MKIDIHSYRFAEAVLKDKAFSAAYDELTSILQGIEPPLYELGKVKKRERNKSRIQFFPVDQKALNKEIEVAMKAKDWEVGPLVIEAAPDGPNTKIKSDFKKARIQVEVQFGNMARWYTDVFKFQLAYSRDAIDVGVLVVPTQRLANLIDENVASFERVIRELPWAKMSLTLPILVISVDASNDAPIKKRYEEATAQFLKDNPDKDVRPYVESVAELAPADDDDPQ